MYRRSHIPDKRINPCLSHICTVSVPQRSILRSSRLPFSLFLWLCFLLFLQRTADPASEASERGNRCPDTRFNLMRIRNILIKTHNPPLNPSLQNHLHSLAPLRAATMTAHSGPLFCLASSLTQGYVSPPPLFFSCLPSVSVIFDPFSLDFQTSRAEGPESNAFVCTSMLSLV